MGGKSDQQKQAEQLMSQYGNIGNQIGRTDFSVDNPFKNYSLPFNYENISKMIDEITQQNLNQVNRSASDQIQQQQGDIAERLASEGVKSSSIKNSAFQNATTDVNRNRYNLSEQLYGRGLEGKLGAMDSQNKYDFAATQAGVNTDLSNMANLFQKYGLLQSNVGAKSGLLGSYDNSTFLDDLFSGINALSGFAQFIPGIGGGGGGGKAGGAR